MYICMYVCITKTIYFALMQDKQSKTRYLSARPLRI